MTPTGRRTTRAIALLLLAVVSGCAGAQPANSDPRCSTPAPESKAPLLIRYDADDFEDDPGLFDRVTTSPFAYFRYTDAAFIEVVCKRYDAKLADMPTVNLHGDAHVEQYAVSDDGRGLADFDTASQGPPIVDFARFATSLVLAAHDPHAADAAIKAFLDGYERALDDPSDTGREPSVAQRLRAATQTTRAEWLAGVEKLMDRRSGDLRGAMKRIRRRYVSPMLEHHPDLDAAFFTVKSAGAIHTGMGSARALKYLLRVEGPTASPDDDVVLEAKQVQRIARHSCIVDASADPDRIIEVAPRLSDTPDRYLGELEIDDEDFYVHEWKGHYREVSVDDLTSEVDLVELAYDVGLDLGRAHPRGLSASDAPRLRSSLHAFVKTMRPELGPLAKELAARVDSAWATFRCARPRSRASSFADKH